MSFTKGLTSGLFGLAAGEAAGNGPLPIPPPAAAAPGPTNTVTDPNAKLPKMPTPATGVPLPELGSSAGPEKDKLGQ